MRPPRIVIRNDSHKTKFVFLEFRFYPIRHRIMSQEPAMHGIQHISVVPPKNAFRYTHRNPTSAAPCGPEQRARGRRDVE